MMHLWEILASCIIAAIVAGGFAYFIFFELTHASARAAYDFAKSSTRNGPNRKHGGLNTMPTHLSREVVKAFETECAIQNAFRRPELVSKIAFSGTPTQVPWTFNKALNNKDAGKNRTSAIQFALPIVPGSSTPMPTPRGFMTASEDGDPRRSGSSAPREIVKALLDKDIDHVKLSPSGSYTPESLPFARLSFGRDLFTYWYAKGGTLSFPGAWLGTRQALFRLVWRIHNIESNTLGIDFHGKMRSHRNPMTLDLFDFCATHLSYWTDFARMRASIDKLNRGQHELWTYLHRRVSADIERLKSSKSTCDNSSLSKRTIGLLAYSAAKYRNGNATNSSECPFNNPAFLFAEATFWSLQRQFTRVVVGACDERDYFAISHLPAWKRFHLSGGSCAINSGEMLLRQIYRRLHSNDWPDVDYVYFTEGDMILNLRRHDDVERVLQAEGVFLPHRMNAFPFSNDVPDDLKFGKKLVESFVTGQLRSKDVIDVSADESHCCLSGRISACRELWWNCVYEHKGIFQNLTAARFSQDGLPVGLATQGGGRFRLNSPSTLTSGPETCQVCGRGVPCPCSVAGRGQ